MRGVELPARGLARKAWDVSLGLLYPERCVGCGAFGVLVCDACRAGMARTANVAVCPHCRAPWDGEGNCNRCLHLAMLEGVIAPALMVGVARRMVHGLKYRGVRAFAAEMAVELAPLAANLELDAAFAVPLHRSRERSRGYNQAELLLERTGLAQRPGQLVRLRKTKTQVGQRLGERRTNVRNAFAYRGPSLAGATVAVVDDVITTGATALECAQVLREAGARRVYAIAFARAAYDPERDAPIFD